MKKKYVYVLKVLSPDMKAYGGFQWPEKGRVVAPDWDPRPVCGGGLHGWLNGEGDIRVSNVVDIENPLNKWLILKVDEKELVNINDEKVKFKSCTIVFNGTRNKAIDFLRSKNSKPSFTNWIVDEYNRDAEIKIGSRSVIKSGKRSKIQAKEFNVICTDSESLVETENDALINCDCYSRIKSKDYSAIFVNYDNEIETGDNNKLLVGSSNKIRIGSFSNIVAKNANTVETGDNSVVISKYNNKLSAGKDSVIYGEESSVFRGGLRTIFICNVPNRRGGSGNILSVKVDNRKIKPNKWYYVNTRTMSFERYYEFNSLKKMITIYGKEDLQNMINTKFEQGLIPRKWKVK